MIQKILLSFAVASALGWALLWRAWPTRPRPLAMVVAISTPLGLALTSALYFLWMIASHGRSRWYPALEVLLLTVSLAILWFRRSAGTSSASTILRRRPELRIATIAPFALAVLLAILSFALTIKLTRLHPWGGWDAWWRINLKAQFLFAGGEGWTWIFQGDSVSHRDYPLLLSCSVARIWCWIGDSAKAGPQVLSVFWGVWAMVILCATVAWLRSLETAALVGLAYLTYRPMAPLSATQMSDFPLVCFTLLACGMLTAAKRASSHFSGYTFLAGLFAGAAAWCKNEGIVFALFIILWWAFLLLRGRRSSPRRKALPMIAGLSVVGGATVTLKAFFAFQSDLAMGAGTFLERASDVSRHGAMLEFVQFLPGLWSAGPLLLILAAFFFLHFRRSWSGDLGAFSCSMALAGVYYLAYVTSPHDVTWHVHTSLDRLMLHVWALLLFGCGMLSSGEWSHET